MNKHIDRFPIYKDEIYDQEIYVKQEQGLDAGSQHGTAFNANKHKMGLADDGHNSLGIRETMGYPNGEGVLGKQEEGWSSENIQLIQDFMEETLRKNSQYNQHLPEQKWNFKAGLEIKKEKDTNDVSTAADKKEQNSHESEDKGSRIEEEYEKVALDNEGLCNVIHSGQKPHQCDVPFSETDKIVQEKKGRKQIGKKPQTCDVCHKSFRTRGYLKIHKRIHNGEKPYQCEKCDMAFKQTSELTVHMLKHTGEKPYQCDKCDSAFSRKEYLTIHGRTHSSERRFKCGLCDKSFTRRFKLKGHMLTHSGEKPYACTICGKSFKRKQRLQEHFRIHTGEKPYKCDVCDKLFRRSEALAKHKPVHSGNKPHACNICGKLFSEKYRLKEHLNIHTGEKPHKCNICDKTFGKKQVLVRHTRTHTGGPRHQCDMCDKSFSRKDRLQLHKRMHSGKKPHACSVCGKSFLRKDHLRNHECTHGNNPYVCHVCDEPFTRLEYLARHLEKSTCVLGQSHQCSLYSGMLEHSPSPIQLQNFIRHNSTSQKCTKPLEQHATQGVDLGAQTGENQHQYKEKTEMHGTREHPGDHLYKDGVFDPAIVIKEESDFSASSLQEAFNSEQLEIAFEVKIEKDLYNNNQHTVCGTDFAVHHTDSDNNGNEFQIKKEKLDICNQHMMADRECPNKIIEVKPIELGTNHELTPVQCDEIGSEMNGNVDPEEQCKMYNLQEMVDNKGFGQIVHYGEKPHKSPSELILDTPVQIGEILHICDVCDKSFSTKSELDMHDRTHMEEKARQCNTCGKTFNKTYSLTLHMRTHTGTKPYTCGVCDKSFTRKDVLERHKRTHTGEKPYACDVCDKAFVRKEHLLNHLRTHSGERPHECGMRNKSFLPSEHLANLTRDLVIHTDEQPHQCMEERHTSTNSKHAVVLIEGQEVMIKQENDCRTGRLQYMIFHNGEIRLVEGPGEEENINENN